jgi:hypothetical protein
MLLDDVVASSSAGANAQKVFRKGSTSRVALLVGAAALAVSVVAFAGGARANILQLSATAFTARCPCVDFDNAEELNGVLEPQSSQSRFFSAVMFPVSGQNVCSFSLVYQDTNASETLTASLKQKKFAVGGATFGAPVTMASVSTGAGAVNTVRKATTSAITNPKITAGNSFYYVEIDQANINLNVLGVQIDVRPTCP